MLSVAKRYNIERNNRLDALVKKWQAEHPSKCTNGFYREFIDEMQQDYTLTELETGRFVGHPANRIFIAGDLHHKFTEKDLETDEDWL